MLFGGRSAEHDVSRVSARHIVAAADPQRYEVLPIGIERDGTWRVAAGAAELIAQGRHDELPDALDIDGAVTDAIGAAAGHSRDGGPGELPVVVLPVLHGPYGEDGTVQGLLEMADLPYVGAGVLGSALAMDKAAAKTVLGAAGIPQPRWRSVARGEIADRPALEALLEEFGGTVFVKPANMGSSIGITKVGDPAGLAAALDLAFEYDDIAVIEQALPIRELECAVLGNETPEVSVVGEIIAGAEFYDFEDKYTDGVARTVVPADIDPATAEAARELALRAFRALRAEGMARVDMFLTPEGNLLINEINTLPGFTPISMYPMLWKASGVDYPQLIDRLVELALQRHERRAAHRTDVISRNDT